ncbi:hypothetical protein [Polymorphobacter fuscus]|uniref:Uncharacterized protein n=1 Tax=Sandarakinorhabdus fusca TaxID=1439888 RepID=A0A7C9KXU5_9SPHN|nr:hypothetical protein [Polymorphobacter fuscus]KAB7648599.1 hypothetical protein F9290_02595 [Polymorphobacter fuscus]MQT16148.1 hypothetical protein [Polymorphobacter fuscus]NJC07573.1 hypothetical protein [Polymorphobacter fuscus]
MNSSDDKNGAEPAETQGTAVRRALNNTPKRDIDRWQNFSKADTAELADDPAAPEDAVLPKAGLARNGGLVDDETR